MATSSVAAALALPEVVAAVDSFNELLPGVPVSKENLRPLLEFLVEKGGCGDEWVLDEPACRITFKVLILAKRLQVVVRGPRESTDALRAQDRDLMEHHRACIKTTTFPATINGLAKALAWAKDMADRLRSEDFCERCRRDGFAPNRRSPFKQLRARPLPMCEDCTLEVALGAPAAKRARGV